MSMVTTKDGVEIFYKDWGPKNAQPIVFHHGWPLSADARYAWGRRPDCTDRRFRATLGEAAQEGHLEGLRKIPARYVYHACRCHQRGSLCLHQEVNGHTAQGCISIQPTRKPGERHGFAQGVTDGATEKGMAP